MQETVRRWRLFKCFMGPDREEQAAKLISSIEAKGFKAKVHAPLPEHKRSGHVHVAVLADLRDTLELAGVVDCLYSGLCAKWRSQCPADFKHGNRTKDYSCLKFRGERNCECP